MLIGGDFQWFWAQKADAIPRILVCVYSPVFAA